MMVLLLVLVVWRSEAFLRRRKANLVLAAQCAKLERDIADSVLSERILLEQVQQMRSLTGELREKLRESDEEKAAIIANATRHATELEYQIRELATRLREAEERVVAVHRAGAENTDEALRRAAAATQEAVELKSRIDKLAADLDTTRKELARTKKQLAAEKKTAARHADPRLRQPSRSVSPPRIPKKIPENNNPNYT